MKKFKPILCIFILITCIFTANASEPFDIIKDKIDRVFRILNDPVYSDQAKKKPNSMIYSMA